MHLAQQKPSTKWGEQWKEDGRNYIRPAWSEIKTNVFIISAPGKSPIKPSNTPMFRTNWVILQSAVYVNHILSQPSWAVAWHHPGGLYIVCPPMKTKGCVTTCNLRCTTAFCEGLMDVTENMSTLMSLANNLTVFHSSWDVGNKSWKLQLKTKRVFGV